MKKFSRRVAKLALGFMCLASQAVTASGADFVGGRSDFRDETIYFAITTRFYDGDTSNNTYCWDGVRNVNDPSASIPQTSAPSAQLAG